MLYNNNSNKLVKPLPIKNEYINYTQEMQNIIRGYSKQDTIEYYLFITNAEGLRTTPSIVAYTKRKELLVGQIAKRQAVINPENTFYSVKRFIGSKELEISEESKQLPYKVIKDSNGNVKVNGENCVADIFIKGDFRVIRSIYDNELAAWSVTSKDKKKSIVLVFNSLLKPNSAFNSININYLNEDVNYKIQTRTQYHNIRIFGTLIKHLVSFLKEGSTLHNVIANRYLLKHNDYEKIMSGTELKHMNLLLGHNFTGTGYEPGDKIMLMEDFGSRLFIIEEENNDE
mgnify:CR=1 FL=1